MVLPFLLHLLLSLYLHWAGYLFSAWYSSWLTILSTKHISLRCLSQLDTTLCHTFAFTSVCSIVSIVCSYPFFVFTDQRTVWLQCPAPLLISSLFTILSSNFNFWVLCMQFMLYFLFPVSDKWEKFHHCCVLPETRFHKPMALNKTPSILLFLLLWTQRCSPQTFSDFHIAGSVISLTAIPLIYSFHLWAMLEHFSPSSLEETEFLKTWVIEGSLPSCVLPQIPVLSFVLGKPHPFCWSKWPVLFKSLGS